MEGTPGPGYDLDDSASAYNGSGDAGATPAVNGEAQDPHAQNNQAGANGQKASNATHMRSRITVVCGECKRLKLKCDRRTPCGSCTKRDTMSRCIYSQAAAEKIDVQSLHNRLMVVENQVASLTTASAASNPSIPPFKSSYPAGSSPSASGPSQGANGPRSTRASSGAALGCIPCNDRYLLVSGPSGSSLVINLEDTSGIWLDELESQLGGIEDSSLSRTTSISPYAVARPAGSNGSKKVKLEPTPVVLSTTPSTATTPSTSSSSTEASAWSGKPTNFGTISGYVAPLPYDIFLVPSDSGVAPGGPGAHMSTFSAIPEYNGSPPPSRPQFPQVTPALLRYLPSTPVRAKYLDSLCEALKVHPVFNIQHFQQRVEAMCQWGETYEAREARAKNDLARDIFGSGAPKAPTGKERIPPSSSPKPTLSFFAATSIALALGSIMTHENDKPALTQVDPLQRNTPAGLYALSKQALQLFEETNSYDIDSVITMLLQVLFLMHDGQMRVEHMVFPLVGKMINVARMMGLAIDPDEFQGTYSLFEAETRRRLWWDIFYYDMVVSECMGHQALVHESTFTTKIPANVDEEKFNPSSTMIPIPEEGSNTSISYFLLRCKALLLVKNIRRAITRETVEDSVEPSVDQAASYEKEVLNFLTELPPPYRLNMDMDITQPLEGDPVLLAQRSAICIVANRIVIKLYLPFMKDTSETSPAKTSHQAVLGTINAAHSIIYASRVLFTVWRDKRPGIFEYYDYTRSLFDAAVICAQAVIQQPSSILASEGMKGINHALEIMKLMTSPAADNSGVAADAIKMVEMMKEKAERAREPEVAAAGTKRKRSDGELHRVATLTTGFTLPFVGPSVSSVKPPRGGQPLMMSKIASGAGKPAEATAPPVESRASSSSSTKSTREKEKGKDKVKYPSVGIRVRGPGGSQPPSRQRTGSTPSVSPPTPAPVVGPPAHSQSQASGSAAQTPVSDRSAGFTYPPPQMHSQPAAPQHPMESMQHDFQMDFPQSTSPENGPMDNSRYSRSYASSPQTSSLYDRQSPYTATHPPPPESFHPPQSQHDYYMSQYPPPPPPSAAYDPANVDHSQGVAMGPFPVNTSLGGPLPPPMTSSVPGTPREPPRYLLSPDKSSSPYDHRLGKTEMHRQMGHEYQQTATTSAHGMAMTATQMTAPYVQGWQPTDMARPDGVSWDYNKYYGQNPP